MNGEKSDRFNAELLRVTTVTPIKRGLKDTSVCRRVPRPCMVTTVTPIKRGLKGTLTLRSARPIMCYNRYPD